MHFAAEAHDFLRAARPDNPLLVFLHGDLGAGKTSFVKACLAELGYPAERVQSPTFLKLLEHPVPNFGLCVHIDAYRMQEREELERLSLESYGEARAWFVEWPPLFAEYLSAHETLRRHLGFRAVWDVRLALKSDGSRAVTYVRCSL